MDIERLGHVARQYIKQVDEGSSVKEKGKVSEGKKAREPDSMSITGESRKFVEMARDIPEVREKLVMELKEAIEKGVYKINIDRIVDKILEGM